ncbi:MAG: cbb3-type cytochrome c oxidase subunit 3 [Anaeromyxobacter sp.]|nr:cbb3-type cytochrome c oxidase subunit 3 [Anaeromyxobacter sp.]MBL0274518.1 cbb3-type cytochrome c oxidase subunit 3 [Anaeromyxobacter sp.]
MAPDTFYLLFGSTLVVVLVGIWIFLYSRKRRDQGEQAKYKMLDDDG